MSLKQRIATFFNPSLQREEKVNPNFASLIVYGNAPQALQTPKNYKNFAKEGYSNDTAYKCIRYISGNGAAIEPKLYTDRSMKKEIEQHPLLDLLRNPNTEQSGVAYREACIAYKLLAGNTYQYALRAKSGPPDELWTLRPDKIEIVASKPRGITGYKFEGFEQPIDPTNIGHTKYWNPDSEIYGLSPIEIAAILIDMQTGTRKWDLALVQNSARPSGAWTTPALLSLADRNKLESKLKEKMSGARNAGTPPVLDGGLTWQSMSQTPAELDWLESIKYNAVLIANIFSMPPQLVGDTSSSTYANVEEAQSASYTEAIFPELDDVYALWNGWLVPMYPDLRGAYLYYDKTSVEVVQKKIQAQKTAESTRAVQAFLSGGCTLNEAREIQGLPKDPQGDVYRFGLVLVPAAKLMEFAEKSLSSGPVAPPTIQHEGDPTALPNTQTIDALPAPLKGLSPLALPQHKTNDRSSKALDLTTLEQKQAHYDAVEATRAKWETKAETQLQDYFSAQQSAVVKAINGAALPSTAILRATSALKKTSSDGEALLLDLYKNVVGDAGSQIAKQLKKEDGTTHEYKLAATSQEIQDFIDLFGESVLDYLESLAGTQIKQIDETTLESIRAQLLAGVANGESIPTLAKRIDGLYLEQIVPNRSKLIARTEVVGASNYGAIVAAKQSGLTLNKVWLATPGPRTREDHAEADGQKVGIDEMFTVGGFEMAHPGDPSAPAKEVCNCRCTTYLERVKAASIDEEKQREPIAISNKRQRREEYRRYMEATLG